jgi:isoleucyl-tRNA synthetase
MAFEQVRSQVNFPKVEGEVLELWERIEAFEKSVERRPKDNPFVFYEGPPTANGRPGFHHALARAFKDLIPRYKTMRGYRVERKGGWDCHGLPVELQVEKELGLSGKNDVEEYGVEEFNRLCRESVFRYVEDWREMSARLGFWVDMDDAYWTLDNSYIESVWWALKNLYERDLLYEGYKVTAHCPRDQTSLSSAEVAMGYETVTDPSVYVKLPLVQTKAQPSSSGPRTLDLVSNTPSPRTRGSSTRPSVDARRLILARTCREGSGEGRHRSRDRKGRELEAKVPPPFDYVPVEILENLNRRARRLRDHYRGHRLVHTAPAYGEDDAPSAPLRPADHPPRKADGPSERVARSRRFVKRRTRLVEGCARGLLFRAEEYEHPYPHCWRCGTPLLYYAKRAWYARTTAVLDDLLRENENINWVPEHIKWGRFGDWLRNNVDWALSR